MSDNRMLSGGGPVTEDHREINPATGQQKAYIVLTPQERAKGFVRPVRREYVHVGLNPTMEGCVLIKAGEGGCGALTKMSQDIAETYARNPKFYSGTFCVGCKKHLPVGAEGGFVWAGSTEKVGT